MTLIAAGWTYSNWSGKRAWEQCKKDLQAQGEVLDWKAYVPPPIPDEQNFAATPSLAIIREKWNKPADIHKFFPSNYDNAYNFMIRLRKTKSELAPVDRELMDLPAWAAGFEKTRTGRAEPVSEDVNKDPAARVKAAVAVLEGLKVYEPIWRELREASTARPSGQFNVDYDNPNPFAILLPHLAELKWLAGILKLRASAELAMGVNDEAYQDVKLILRLGQTVRTEQILISSLVDMVMLRIATDVAWEGLVTGSWSTAQLEGLQKQFAELDIVASMPKVLGAERAFCLKFIDFLQGADRDAALRSLGNEYCEVANVSRVVPRGWFYKEKVNYAQFFQEMFLAGQGYASGRIYPEKAQAEEQKFEGMLHNNWRAVWKHHILTGMLVPAIGKVPYKAAEIQTVLGEATLACALERYHRAKGEFPEQLDALISEFVTQLPHDVITGKPLIYRRTVDGQFQLYGVAWDGQDDGGLVPRTKSYERQDWVWRYPAKAMTKVAATR